MSRFFAYLLSCALLLPVLPAWAQPSPDRPRRGPAWEDMPSWGPGPMMWGPGRMGGWDGPGHPAAMIVGLFVLLFALIGVAALIYLLVRLANRRRCHHGYRYGGHDATARALGILAERLARGEIDKAEFEDKRRLLGG